jgi:hypothetical protein
MKRPAIGGGSQEISELTGNRSNNGLLRQKQAPKRFRFPVSAPRSEARTKVSLPVLKFMEDSE